MAPTIQRWQRRLFTVAVTVLVAGVVSASPASAQDDLFDPAPPVSAPSTGDQGTGDPPPDDSTPAPGNGGGDDPAPDTGDLVPDDADAGPVGHTGVPTFDVVRPPGDDVPSQVTVVNEGTDVELHTTPGEGVDAFVALLYITSADAPTEYRFNNAVPADVTVYPGEDGSLLFLDSAGEEAGFISMPWAIDSDGNEVPTSYSVEGTTLVQTVNHVGATYPVLADPSWWEKAAAWAGVAAAAVGAGVCLASVCGAVGTAVAVVSVVAAGVYVVSQMIPDSKKKGGKRPSNNCNMRSRRGC